MTNKECIFIGTIYNFVELTYPSFDSWFILFWKFWHNDFKTFSFQFFLKPREPPFFGVAIPTVNYINPFIHCVMNRYYKLQLVITVDLRGRSAISLAPPTAGFFGNPRFSNAHFAHCLPPRETKCSPDPTPVR